MYIVCVLVVKFCECLWWRWGSVCVLACVCVHIYACVCIHYVYWWYDFVNLLLLECVCVHILCAYIVCDWWLNFVNDSDAYTGGGLLFLKTSFNKAACLICVDVFFNSILIHKGSRMHLYFTVFMCSKWLQLECKLYLNWEVIWNRMSKLSTHHMHSFCEQML